AFLTQANIFNILRQVAVVGIAAVGMTFVMLTGGIDFSVGSIIGVSGIITASLMVAGVHPVLAVVIALLCGAVMGFFNALIINKFKVPALIVTLGMVTSLRGVAYMVTGGLPVFGFPESFSLLGQGYMWIIPVPVIIMVLTFIIGYIILEKFSIGRYIYGVGGNEEASRLSGISVDRIKYFVYSMSGFLCALAGVVLLSRTNSGQPKAGTGYEMDIITAVVLGGVSITGGEGKITSVIAGVLIMGILSNGMIITNVGDYAQRIVQGMVLIIAVAFDIYQKNRKTTLKDVVNLENA
ncbi:MAG: ABC transporter permease, partial [Vallitaleaceae bacterium]|nr:ABC transporter permease [Vallitaleaceae bacterium]